MVGIIRVVHPAPAVAVVVLSLALAAILAAQAGLPPFGSRTWLTTLAVLGSQIVTGAVNDWADRQGDALAQPDKPIPAGQLTPRGALWVAGAGAILQGAASAPLGGPPLALGAVATASAVTYSLWLSRTRVSVVPYLVSFGILPLWIATGVGVPLVRVAAAPLLVAPFAAAAHLANALRDFEADAAFGRRNLAQALGRRTAHRAAWLLAMGVGVGAGALLLARGGVSPAAGALGLIGLAAVGQGAAGPRRLWIGMLVAAVCWTTAWALATGNENGHLSAPVRALAITPRCQIASSSSISSSSVSSVSFSHTKSPARMVSGMTMRAARIAPMPMTRTLSAFMAGSPLRYCVRRPGAYSRCCCCCAVSIIAKISSRVNPRGCGIPPGSPPRRRGGRRTIPPARRRTSCGRCLSRYDPMSRSAIS
ncbi:MAG: UbiA family prenyltransferase [Chloroflexi bacterium]|nr:UbiA family prenyltransferase [Chloroflexota bacterium]